MAVMGKQEFLDLCAAYALGALDGDERALFRRAAAHADAEMRAALAEALKLAGNLSLAAPEAAPSAAVKNRLMARVRAGELAGAAPRRGHGRAGAERPALERFFGARMRPRLGLAAAFTSLVAAAGLVAYDLSLRDALNAQRTALTETHQRMEALADSTRTRITALEDSLGRKEALLAVIRSRDMQMVALGGMEDTAGYGKIIWDPVRKTAVLQVSLPPEHEGMDYQLWVIRDRKPMNAGVFQVRGRGRDGFYRIDQLVETDKRHINAFAVTMEPKGGMPHPTGKMYLMGAMEL